MSISLAKKMELFAGGTEAPLLITPLRRELKLPSIRANFKSPRRIPKECQYFDRKNILQLSKTPLPYYKQVKYSISKEFLVKTMNKVQHVTLVKNLADHHASMLANQESDKKTFVNRKISQPADYFKDLSLESSRSRVKPENFELSPIS